MSAPTPWSDRDRLPRTDGVWSRRAQIALATFGVVAALGLVGREWLPVTARARQPTSATGATTATAATQPDRDGRMVRVGFTWEANTEPDLAGYVVSWGDKPGVYTSSKTVGPKPASVEFTVALRPEPYYVAVQARNAAGELSGFSNEFSVDVSSGRARPVKPGKASAKPKREKPPKVKKEKKPKKEKRQKALPPSPPE